MIGHSSWRGRTRRRWTREAAAWGCALSALALVAGCSSDSNNSSGVTGGSGGGGGDNVAGSSSAGTTGEAGTSASLGGTSSSGGAGGASAGMSGTSAGAGGSIAGASAGGTGGSSAGAGDTGGATAGTGGTAAGGVGGSAAGAGGTGGATTGTGGTGGSSVGSGGTGGTGGGAAGTGGTGGAAAGTGGTGGTTTGAGGTGGSGGNSAGSGGTGGSTAGAAGTGGSTAGAAGTGGSGGTAAVDPDGAIVTGSALTTTIAGVPPAPITAFSVWDTCPDNEVVVGYNWVAFGDFVSGLQAICGKLTVTKTTQLQVSIAAGDTLLARGGDSPATSGTSKCPANSVIVGFSGSADDRIRTLTFTCAPITLVFEDGSPTIGVNLDNKAALTTIAAATPHDGATPFAFTGCPDGQMARGDTVQEGEFRDPNGWAEQFSLMCGTASFTFPNGVACADATDCDSRACSTTCQAFTCDAPAGCTCKPFEGKNYAFCPATATSTASDAEGICETKAMHLAWDTDSSASGWLRFAANAATVTGDAYIGVNDLTTHGTWDLEPGDTAATFTNWGGGGYGLEPNCLNGTDCNGTIENCVTIRGDGAWNNVDCSLMNAFICSN